MSKWLHSNNLQTFVYGIHLKVRSGSSDATSRLLFLHILCFVSSLALFSPPSRQKADGAVDCDELSSLEVLLLIYSWRCLLFVSLSFQSVSTSCSVS